MQTTLELVFRHMEPAEQVEARVRQRAERLERFFGRIDSCAVAVEAAQQRQNGGAQYAVKIRLRVPGGELSVDRGPGQSGPRADVLTAVRDAFDAAERQLSKWKQRHSGRPPEHAAPPRGRIAELRAEDGWGWIETTEGARVYFHRNAVHGADFARLSEGDAVEVSIDYDDAEEGPHASSVRPISAQRFVDRPN